MLALRRSACSRRFQSYSKAGIAWISYTQFCLPDCESGKDASSIQLLEHTCISITNAAGNNTFSKAASSQYFASSNPFLRYRRTLSSQATTSAKSSDLEDGFLEQEDSDAKDDDNDIASDETHESDTKALPSQSGDDSEPEDGVEVYELNLLGNEKDVVKALPENMILFNALLKAPRLGVAKAISMYAEDGHSLTCKDVSAAMFGLRRRKLFHKALQLSEWVESNKCYVLTDHDYATHIDLIAKVHGLYTAEKHIAMIPESFQSEFVYRTLLANSVSSGNIKKVEEIFNKMRELGLPLTDFACNQLLLVYSRIDKKKVADVLMMMEKENVKPSKMTYKIMIEIKGRSNNIDGMEQVIKTMKAEGMDIDKDILALVARYYISGGFKEKAEAILKEIEGDDLQKKNRWAIKFLLPLYASLGKEEDVQRIWKLSKEKTFFEDSIAAIEAWGKLGRIDRAEEVIEQVCKTRRNVSPQCYSALLKVYSEHKLLAKGKELIKKMSNEGCNITPFTMDALVRLYLGADEVERADYVLHKMTANGQMKPLYGTYMALLEKYGKRGDVHNAEKIFYNLRKNGYTGRINMYQSLLSAYITAKTPAYGFRDRMKADNIFPNNALAGQLRTIENIKKFEVPHLLFD